MEKICNCKLKNNPGALIAGSASDEFNFADSYNNTAFGFYLLFSGFAIICVLVFLTCKALQYLEKRNSHHDQSLENSAQIEANHSKRDPIAIENKQSIPGPVWATMADLSLQDTNEMPSSSRTDSTKTLPSYASLTSSKENQNQQTQPPQQQLTELEHMQKASLEDTEIILRPCDISAMLSSSLRQYFIPQAAPASSISLASTSSDRKYSPLPNPVLSSSPGQYSIPPVAPALLTQAEAELSPKSSISLAAASRDRKYSPLPIQRRMIELNTSKIPIKTPEVQLNVRSLPNTTAKNYITSRTATKSSIENSDPNFSSTGPGVTVSASESYKSSEDMVPLPIQSKNDRDLYVILKEQTSVTREPPKTTNTKIWFPKSRFSYASAIQNQSDLSSAVQKPKPMPMPIVESEKLQKSTNADVLEERCTVAIANREILGNANEKAKTDILSADLSRQILSSDSKRPILSTDSNKLISSADSNRLILSSDLNNPTLSNYNLKDTAKRQDFMVKKQTEFLKLQHQIRLLEEKLNERSNTLSFVSQENIEISQKNLKLQQELAELQELLRNQGVESPIKVSKINYDFTELNQRISALQNAINFSPRSYTNTMQNSSINESADSSILIQKIHDLRAECQARILETRAHFEQLYSQKAHNFHHHFTSKLEAQTQEFISLQSKLNLMESRIISLTKEKFMLESKLKSMETNQNSLYKEKSEYAELIQALESEKQQILSEYQDLLEIKVGLDTEISMYRTLVENANEEELESFRSEKLSSSDGESQSSRSKTPQSPCPINENEIKIVYDLPKKIIPRIRKSAKDSETDLPSLESAF